MGGGHERSNTPQSPDPGTKQAGNSTLTKRQLSTDCSRYRSLTYGRPSAFGATALPMKPASSTTVSTYGRA